MRGTGVVCWEGWVVRRIMIILRYLLLFVRNVKVLATEISTMDVTVVNILSCPVIS